MEAVVRHSSHWEGWGVGRRYSSLQDSSLGLSPMPYPALLFLQANFQNEGVDLSDTQAHRNEGVSVTETMKT